MSEELRTAATGLPSGSADVVFARALVHHVADLGAVVRETYRLLVPGGRYLVQDRTMADVDEPAGPDHVRGYLLEALPRLRDVEARRRPDPSVIEDALRANGFEDVTRTTLRETRRTCPDREGYLAEVRTRNGRSILHELDDAELARLVDALRARLTAVRSSSATAGRSGPSGVRAATRRAAADPLRSRSRRRQPRHRSPRPPRRRAAAVGADRLRAGPHRRACC